MKRWSFIFSMLMIIVWTTLPLRASQYCLEPLNENMLRGYLDNGMEFVLIEKHAAPVIAVIVTIKAGSRFETAENNGVSHFLEHLLFNGTEKRTQKQIYDEMDEIGAYNNASTSEDYVNFMILSATEHIDKAMDVQSDMLFNSVFPQEKFEKEKGIVIEEIGQSYARADYLAELYSIRTVYDGTSYGRPVLGTPNSIENLTRQAVMDYYQNFYAPNNMILMAVGDFDKDEMIAKIEKWYGSYSARNVKNKKNIPAPVIRGKQFRRVELENKNSTLHLVFPAPRYGSKDFFAYELLSDVLNSDGPHGLAKNFPENKGVYSINAGFEYHPDFSLFNIEVSYEGSRDGRDVLSRILKTLASLAEKKIEGPVLDGLRVGILTENEINAERPHFYGMLKSQLLAVGGTELVAGYIDSLKKVFPEQINAALQNLSRADYIALAFEPPTKSAAEAETTAKEQTLEKKLDNGLTLIVRQQSGSDIFALHVLARNRSLMEPQDKQGIADILHQMLARGPKTMSPEDFSRALEAMGVHLKVTDNPYIPFDDYYSSPEFSFIRVECLDDFSSKTVDLLKQMIAKPALRQKDLAEIKSKQMMMIRRKSGSASIRASKLFWQKIAPKSPLTKSIWGTMATVQSITVKDLQAFHARYFSPDNLILSVVSKLPADEVMDFLQKEFASLRSSSQAQSVQADYSVYPVSENTYLEAQVGKRQSAIIVGNAIPNVAADDQAALYIANEILSSRIAFQLREKEGLAYRIGSRIEFVDGQAVIYARMGTRAENLQRAQQGLINGFKNLRTNPPDEKEVVKAVNQIKGRRLMRQLLSISRAYLMGYGEFKYHDVRAFEKFTDSLSQVNAEKVKNAVIKYMPQDAFVIAVAK